MDRERLTTLAAAYGGDLRRWPELEREAARNLLASDADAGRLLNADADLDEALDAWRVAAPSHVLRAAVLARTPRAARVGAAAWLAKAGAWMSGAGLATAAVAGLLVGAALTPSAPHVGEFEAMSASIYSDAAAPLNTVAEPESVT